MTKNKVLRQGQNYSSAQGLKRGFIMVDHHLKEFNGRQIAIDQNPLMIQANANKQWLGAVCQNVKIG